MECPRCRERYRWRVYREGYIHTLYRCLKCGFIFIDRRLTGAATLGRIGRVYEKPGGQAEGREESLDR